MTFSTEYYTLLDLRDRSVEELPVLLQQHLAAATTFSVLWQARRPRKRWHLDLVEWRPLVLSSASQFEQILWLHPEQRVELPEQFEREDSSLLASYSTLFDGRGPLDNCPRWEAFQALLNEHIERQEKSDFPFLLSGLPVERAVRELGYEHHGLRRGMESVKRAAEAARDGKLSRAEREKIDLDFFHLLEHHLERERDAVVPATVFLKGLYRDEGTCYNPRHRVVPT